MDANVTIVADVDRRVHLIVRESFLEPAILVASAWNQMVSRVPAPRDASTHHAGLGVDVRHVAVVALSKSPNQRVVSSMRRGYRDSDQSTCRSQPILVQRLSRRRPRRSETCPRTTVQTGSEPRRRIQLA